jgi:hypothetical protein
VTAGEMGNPWLTLSSKRVYDNPWITVREDEVVRLEGEPGIYGVVHHKNLAVGVLPVERITSTSSGSSAMPCRGTLGRYPKAVVRKARSP